MKRSAAAAVQQSASSITDGLWRLGQRPHVVSDPKWAAIASLRRVDGFAAVIGLLVSYKPLARAGRRAQKTKIAVPQRLESRHGQRDREAPRGAEDRRRAGRQAPQGVDLELPFELRREGRGHDQVDDP